MKTKIFTFFVLVFGFCAFADGVWDGPVRVCSELDCNSLKEYLNMIYRVTNETYNDIDTKREDIFYANSNIKRYVSNLDTDQSGLLAGLNYETGAIETLVTQMHYSIGYWNATSGGYGTQFREYIDHIDCSLCSNGQCIDLTVVTNILSQVTEINTNLISLSSDVSVSFVNITNYLSLLSVGVDNINTNLVDGFSALSSRLVDIQTDISVFDDYLINYLPYLETINSSLAYLATNEYFNVNVNNLTNYFVAKSSNVGVGTAPYQRMSFTGVISEQSPLNPYNSPSSIRRSNMAESLQGGFVNLLFSVSSLNNYFYWLMQYLGTNKTDYSAITTGLANLTNILNRVDDYVLGDFSNQFYNVFENIDTLVSNSLNKVDYTTNLLVITEQLYTNNNHLASIDSKLDVLDYIKVLSNTPLSDFSGDSYYDYLTNLYLNGASSASPSTNWFERIEILLASMVFGDSASSSISNEVEFTNFSEETIENAFNDYTFQNELNSGIDLVENTGGNFLTILRGFHNAIASVSQPQSIAIGLGGLDGKDTTTYEDVMHGHFQVSFSSGEVDSFTLIVRSMTTIIWILITMMFVYFSARWLLSKVLFFYRLMRTLISSLFLK